MRTIAFLTTLLPLYLVSAEVNFNSQASQDKFVYNLLYKFNDKQDPGYYLEIGSGDPVKINNSYAFEKDLNWSGVSIDISEEAAKNWDTYRKNPLFVEDATKSNYRDILSSFPEVIDYLSLDIDGYYCDVLKQIPFDEHVFKVITIEHDFYRFGNVFRDEERVILNGKGYYLLCSDVSNDGLSFEDWWIHPSAYSSEVFTTLTSLDLGTKDHKEILLTLQSTMDEQND